MASTNNSSLPPAPRRVRKPSTTRVKPLSEIALLEETLSKFEQSKSPPQEPLSKTEVLKTTNENKEEKGGGESSNLAPTLASAPVPYYERPDFLPAFVPHNFCKDLRPGTSGVIETPGARPTITSSEELLLLGEHCREFDFNAANHLQEEARAAGWKELADVFEVIPFETKRVKRLKAGKTTLTRKHGYFIVPCLGKFYYYKISPLIDDNPYLFRFGMHLPPVLKEGIVYVNKQAYFVPLEDLRRKVVRKSYLLPILKTSPTYDDFYSGAAFQPQASPRRKTSGLSEALIRALTESSPETPLDGEEGGGSAVFGGNDLGGIDRTFESQAEALLDTLFKEEGQDVFEEGEWEISESV